ncbi:Beta-galactosidase [Arthrobotrys entomopaga]|nr:Beta-galactosidase [Arthrobotrys entomopaga]
MQPTSWATVCPRYDYAAAIAEDRTLREKYYEEKLQALFLKVSPAYLTSTPGTPATVSTSGSQMTITTLKDNVGGKTRFNIIRQSNPNQSTNSNWKLSLTTSAGTLSVPTLNNANFVLPSHDSKTIVTDYSAGGANILYSTSEILTWQVIDGKTIIVLYANKGETGETAFITSSTLTSSVLSGNSGSVSSRQSGSTFTIQYQHTGVTVISLSSNVLLYVVEHVDAYNFWVPELGIPVIVKGGYLLRGATFSGNTLALSGDTNGTTTFEVFAGSAVSTITWNGKGLNLSKTSYGSFAGSYSPTLPSVTIPTLSSLTWKCADSLPEIQSSYNDSKWVSASNTDTPNSQKPSTPVILYASDYGFHTGNILWRGHFTATGGESAFKVTVQGGSGFGYSVWDNGVFIGAWTGNGGSSSHSDTFTLSTWSKGSKHVITVVQDHSGLEQNW